MSIDNISTELNIIMITFYPKFINNIRSYHILSLNEYNDLINIVNDKHFFIENFLRISKISYEHVSNDNINITIIENEKKNIISDYLDIFNNDFDIYNMIMNNYISESDSISSISDEDLADTINIIKLFNHELNNEKDKINNIINNNPHLLQDDDVSEYIQDIDKIK